MNWGSPESHLAKMCFRVWIKWFFTRKMSSASIDDLNYQSWVVTVDREERK